MLCILGFTKYFRWWIMLIIGCTEGGLSLLVIPGDTNYSRWWMLVTILSLYFGGYR